VASLWGQGLEGGEWEAGVVGDDHEQLGEVDSVGGRERAKAVGEGGGG
jgi:hypothetical protein